MQTVESSDFVPLEVLAEDADAFAAWDAENPAPAHASPAHIEFLLTFADRLRRDLLDLQGRDDAGAGRTALDRVKRLISIARSLNQYGYSGPEANVERYIEAHEALIEALKAQEHALGAGGGGGGGSVASPLIDWYAPPNQSVPPMIKGHGPIPAQHWRLNDIRQHMRSRLRK